jgi:type I restriction enzyme M protein
MAVRVAVARCPPSKSTAPKRLCDVFDDESRVLQPEPGMEIYDPTCGSGGLLIKCETAAKEWGHSCPQANGKNTSGVRNVAARLKLYGQEYVADTWAMACMNMIIHDMEGTIEIGDTFKNPKFRDKRGKLRTFDRVIG